MGLMTLLEGNLRYVVGGVGLGCCVFGVSIIPQTLALNLYKRSLSAYKEGAPQTVSQDMLQLAQKVVADIPRLSRKLSKLDFFVCYGHNPMHLGSLRLGQRALVGVPPTFFYQSEDDIDKKSMQVYGREINWSTDTAHSLASSLLLSPRAQAFALARELSYSTHNHVVTKAFMQSLLVASAFVSGHFLTSIWQMKAKPQTVPRRIVYVLVGCAYLLLYVGFKDIYECWRDKCADRDAAKTGLAYAAGGVEYYDKILQRNKSLRDLMGSKVGPIQFTAYGNTVATWRRATVPLTERRELVVKYLLEMQKLGVEDKEFEQIQTTH